MEVHIHIYILTSIIFISDIIQMISPVFLDTAIYIEFDLKYKTRGHFQYNNGNKISNIQIEI